MRARLAHFLAAPNCGIIVIGSILNLGGVGQGVNVSPRRPDERARQLPHADRQVHTDVQEVVAALSIFFLFVRRIVVLAVPGVLDLG